MKTIPFDYDKYAADRSAWNLYDRDDNQIVALFKSEEDDIDYPLKGVVKCKCLELYKEQTWTLDGCYVASEDVSPKDIIYMEPVEVKKSVAPIIKLHPPLKLRNLYYDNKENRLTMSMSTYSDYESAAKVALNEIKVHPDKEHLCVFSMEDHPQIREILIAKGLAEVLIENG